MESKTIEILKAAILMERRGIAFYTVVAEQTASEDVKKIFSTMAIEERLHARYLSEQYTNFLKNETFEFFEPTEPHGVVEMILSDKVKQDILAAGFEAAAISAAIDMENKAIEVYSNRAVEATDPKEKELYQWLADWEKGHHKILHELDEQLKEKIWFDNQFWPF
jgi:rubrerythrin